MSNDRTESPVVLITGGTKGIGAGIAKTYLMQGYHVVICARNAPSEPIRCDTAEAVFIACNLKQYESIQSLFEQVKTRYGRLDVVINNAGGSPSVDAGTVSPRFNESILHLNLIAPLHVAQLAFQYMQDLRQDDESSCIIFIGSISALRASPGTAAYGAAKAGILSLVQSLAVEWAPHVRVVAISPGLIRTELSHLHYGDEAGIEAVEKTIPLQRLGNPEDVAQACLYASSKHASYLSGSNILLHGGGESPAFLHSDS